MKRTEKLVCENLEWSRGKSNRAAPDEVNSLVRISDCELSCVDIVESAALFSLACREETPILPRSAFCANRLNAGRKTRAKSSNRLFLLAFITPLTHIIPVSFIIDNQTIVNIIPDNGFRTPFRS